MGTTPISLGQAGGPMTAQGASNVMDIMQIQNQEQRHIIWNGRSTTLRLFTWYMYML